MNGFENELEILVGAQLTPRQELSRKQRKALRRDRRAFSANLVVDLQGTCQMYPSIVAIGGLGSGLSSTTSGQAIVGASVNMLHADTYTNLLVAGVIATSGQLQIAVQTSDTDVSGSYTDPTSGLQTFPTSFQSGGILWINSGGSLMGTIGGLQIGATSGQVLSGQAALSGFCVAAAFQRVGTFCRAVALSGAGIATTFTASFIGQLRTTGSGGGFDYRPSSGVINV
jgi:hypothetical protein